MSMISELVKELRWIAEHEYQSRNSEDTIRRAADTIEMLSAKVREPKQGGWIRTERDVGETYPEIVWTCSVCGDYDYVRNYKYCPHCGARMKEGEKTTNIVLIVGQE